MMHRIMSAMVLFTALQGCATSSEVFLADGSKGYNINCGGTVMNYGHCLEKAGEICGARGYLVVDQTGDVAPFSTAVADYGANTQAASGAFYAQSGAMVTRNLFIKCK